MPSLDICDYCRDVDYTFIMFLRYLRDKWRKDFEAEGWDDEKITDRIIDMIEVPHKYQKEFSTWYSEVYNEDK